MSTRTDWGYFRQDGSRLEPVAVGDAWARWVCPNREWVHGATEVHPFTGEATAVEPYLEPKCPMRPVGIQREACTRCDIVFLYP